MANNNKQSVKKVIVTAGILNVRSAPSIESDIVGKLYKDDVVEVLKSKRGKSRDFYKMNSHGGNYIMAQYTTDLPETSVDVGYLITDTEKVEDKDSEDK